MTVQNAYIRASLSKVAVIRLEIREITGKRNRAGDMIDRYPVRLPIRRNQRKNSITAAVEQPARLSLGRFFALQGNKIPRPSGIL